MKYKHIDCWKCENDSMLLRQQLIYFKMFCSFWHNFEIADKDHNQCATLSISMIMNSNNNCTSLIFDKFGTDTDT